MQSAAAAARSSLRMPSVGRALSRQRFHQAVMADCIKAQPYRATSGHRGMRSSFGSPEIPERAGVAPAVAAGAHARPGPGPAQ
eukprot:3809391-Lingulodinium_polyedra.AAC.1